MRKLFLLLVISLAGIYAWAGGIGSAKDLQDFIVACNKGEPLDSWSNADGTVVLTADIDLSKTKKLPQVKSFSGAFDGCGYKITGWKTSCGLFRELTKKAVVSGIVIDASCLLKANARGSEYHAGFIADSNFGIVRDCVNYGKVEHKCEYAIEPNMVGAIVGFNRFVVLRCSNYGEVVSDVSGVNKPETTLSVGGIAGGCGGKTGTSSVIARCTNEGRISVVSNLSAMYVGGICGSGSRSTVKYCVNKGAVDVRILANEDGSTKGIASVGGIAGHTKSDILRCDNFATVDAGGECGVNVGGICGMPHAELVIADCSNYGGVTTRGEEISNTGGIAGNIGRPVHIRGCSNFGKIVFDGISSRARSTAGGIAGNIYVTKTAVEGAYIRECFNHGEVRAASGGNKYDSKNRNAIHAGGVVAYAEARPGMRAFIKDCGNDGAVVCPSGRSGNLVASAPDVVVGGLAPSDRAELLDKALPDGSNVCGRVTTPEGKALGGIVVTDGRQCVKTAEDGSYSMKSNLSETVFIYLSLPSNVKVPVKYGVPQIYRRVPRYATAVRADFVLEEKSPVKDYTVLMIADPQVRPYGMDDSMERWADTVAPDAESLRASLTGEVYSINLGDLVYNYMYAWDDYMDVSASIACPTFNIIGNHDYDQGTLFETEQGNVYFETYVGPEHYSFDLGDVHYVVANTILYDRASTADKYHYGLDERAMEWLEADLANVSKDRSLVVCVHAQLFKHPGTSPNGSHGVYNLNYKRYLSLLSQYKKVYVWNGHYHRNFYYNYEGKDVRHGAPNIQCISVARCTGALRHNKYLGAMGEPMGYMVMDVKGDQMEWYYKPVGHGRETQMRAYSPERTEDGTVKVNVWNWSEGWSLPQWYENGVKVADMEFTPGIDPDYYDLFLKVESPTTRKYCTPSSDAFLFTVTPSEGVTSGEIRVTDMFGETYVQKIEWNINL